MIPTAIAVETRTCSTPGCRRIPDADWAICRDCCSALFAPLVSPQAKVERLSETDPVSQLMAAQIAARRGR